MQILQNKINSLVEAGILHMRSQGAGRRATIYHLRELSLIAQGLPIGRFDY